jgi:hypothetical protein
MFRHHFLFRLLLLAGLVFGTAPQVSPPVDTALAWARMAGALCLADGPEGTPVEHPHDHCLACQGSLSSAGLAATVTLPSPVSVNPAVTLSATSVAGKVGWAAYASRAPPVFPG